MLALLGMVGLGTIIELTSCGDEDDYKGGEIAMSLYHASLFRRLYQYDAVLLQRKKPWARFLTCFSLLRNGVNLNIQPRGLRDSVQKELAKEEVPYEKKIADNLRALTGMKGVAAIWIIWGSTFWFGWMSYLSNGDELPAMVSSVAFTIVSCTVFIVPLFLFISGFL